jgi:Flp pilus assembly protein TadB
MLVAALAAAFASALSLRPHEALSSAKTPTPTRRMRRPSTPVIAAASAAVLVLALVPGAWAVPAAGVAALGTARSIRRLEPAATRRRRARLEATLPQVVDLLSTCLAAGASPSGAIARVLPVVDGAMGEELSSFVGRLELGADPASVWSSMGTHPQLGPLGRTLRRSAETGSSVADALTGLSAELRAQRRAAMEARARTVEVKAALPLGLCLLPAFVLIGIVPMVAGSFSLTFLGA